MSEQALSQEVLQQRAAALLALHQPGNPVVLPTVWDAWSAKLAVVAGFAALTVGSHPVADSIGKLDGEGMSFDDLVTRVAQITAAVDVPVSVDIESGYAEAAKSLAHPGIVSVLDVGCRGGLHYHTMELIEGEALDQVVRRRERLAVLAAGAVGLNIEDTVHKEGKRLRTPEEHAALVGALRKAADASGVHVVVNARTDLFLRQDGEEADRVERAVSRLKLAAGAGADSLYPVGRHDPETLRRLTSELPLPVNAIALPDVDDPASFGPLGVGRISFGPFLQAALARSATEILARWR